MLSWSNGWKTYIVSGIAILYAVSQWYAGGLSQTDAVVMIEIALAAMGIRHGVSTEARK